MELMSIKEKMIFRLLGLVLCLKWCFILISMDAYLFYDVTSLIFWRAGLRCVFFSFIFGSGLIISSTHFGQKYKPISIGFLLISLISSLFLITENIYGIFWLVLALIHIYAIVILTKSFNIKPCFVKNKS